MRADPELAKHTLTGAGLAAELRGRVERDQEVRLVPHKTAQDIAHWMEVDSDNQRWIWQVLRELGWPGIALVGEQGSADAWLLIQHADRDRPLQRFALALLIEAVDGGDADPSHIAYLADRIHLHAGVPTRYGTQYARNKQGRYRILPVEAGETLDIRRADLGVPSVAEFEREAFALYEGVDMLESTTLVLPNPVPN